MAPELLVKNQFYNQKVDIWATGIMLFKMLAGDHVQPYKDVSNMDDLRRIAMNLQRYSKEKPYYSIENCFGNTQVSEACKDFLHHALIVDINSRKSARWLLLHPWIQEHCP